jgi:hypothetical protein
MACSTGCLQPGTHRSYGDCLRSKNLQVQDVETHRLSVNQNRVIDDYVAARRDGLQPEGVTAKAVKQAREFTDITGVPFRADK